MGHAGGHLLFTNSTDAMALLLLGFNLPLPVDSKE